MNAGFDPYHKWLGIPPKEQPPNHYRLLGINPFETDADVISHAADQRMAHLRSFQNGPQASLSQRLLNEISQARVTLLNPAQKVNYDAGLKAQPGVVSEPTPEEATAPLSPKIRVTRPRLRKQANPAIEVIKFVAGGVFGLFLAVLVLPYFAGIDLLGWQKKQPDESPSVTEPSHSGKPISAQPKVPKQDGPLKRVPVVAKSNQQPRRTSTVASGGTSTPKQNDELPAKTSANSASRAAFAPPRAVAPFDATQAREHQEAWARHLGVPVEFTNSIGMKFRLILPAEFVRGSSPAELNDALKIAGNDQRAREWVMSESPQHTAMLTRPFYLGVYEVTQAEYRTVIGKNPSFFASTGPDKQMTQSVASMDTSRHPVEGVSWNDAADFCIQLSQRENLKGFYHRTGDTVTMSSGTGYRLPTEAEWEFACRAGTTTRYWVGGRDELLLQAGWFVGNSSGHRTSSVGELKANAFGLHDVHGNVWELLQDWWTPTYYQQFKGAPALDPQGPANGTWRATRGGGWSDPAFLCRASDRHAVSPTHRTNHIGFRVALVVEGSSTSNVTPAK